MSSHLTNEQSVLVSSSRLVIRAARDHTVVNKRNQNPIRFQRICQVMCTHISKQSKKRRTIHPLWVNQLFSNNSDLGKQFFVTSQSRQTPGPVVSQVWTPPLRPPCTRNQQRSALKQYFFAGGYKQRAKYAVFRRSADFPALINLARSFHQGAEWRIRSGKGL